MKIQKKHLVLATLVIALSGAVYLNWQFAENKNTQAVSKELGEAKYVNATAPPSAKSTVDEAVETANMTGEQQEYFANARNQRDQTQDKILDTSSEILQSDSASGEDCKAAVEQIEKLLKNFTYQDSIESILKAKGFSQCLCYISDQGCSVVVLKDEMNETSSLMIKDAVTSQVDIPFDNITIAEV